MARIESPTASAAASQICGIQRAQRMPTLAEMRCPPTKGQGLATGLWGMANRITADAPMDAKSVFKPPPSMVKLASQPVRKIATLDTKAVRIFSLWLSGEA